MASIADTLGEIRLPITASLIATLVLVAFTWLYWHATGNLAETLIFLAALGAAIGTILGAFYSARALTLTARALAREDVRGKTEIALRFTSKWNDPAMFHVRDAVREIFALAHDSPEIDAKIRAKETNLFHFMNFLEEISIAIDIGHADPNILREAFAGVVKLAWTRLSPWVTRLRNSRNNQRIWMHVEQLAGKWR